jgi:DnaJ homolog subfamily A member 5
VLSDPQERAWYDSHESAILSGDDGNAGDNGAQQQHYERNVRLTTADEVSRIILKFNARVEFSDSPSGFFGFLRDTFDDLVAQEAAVVASATQMHPSDAQAEIVARYPSFGHKDDTHEDIRSFYAAWSSFATNRSYAWVDRWRPSDAPDRRTRRVVEKENRRLRDDAIQEFNEAVRALVEFAKKRDPRYKPTVQSDAERQKALKDAAAAQRARARAANEERLKDQVVPDWAQSREPEHDPMEAGEDVWDEEEEEVLEFECVACHKTFKSEKQFEAHEKSKKHQKAVYALRKKMQKEDAELILEESAEDESPVDRTESDEEVATMAESTAHVQLSDEDSIGDENSTQDGKDPQVSEGGGTLEATSSPQPDAIPSDSEADLDDDEYAPREAVEDRLKDASNEDDLQESQKTQSSGKPKMGKAAQKRAKKAAQQAILDAEDAENKFACATCKSTFPSRTRMFQHIKDFGHAAPVPAKKKLAKAGKRK